MNLETQYENLEFSIMKKKTLYYQFGAKGDGDGFSA